MPASTLPNLGLTAGWDPGENGWGAAMNANLQRLDAAINLSVLSATRGTPNSTAEGARFIVPVGGTGDFAGQDNKLAVRRGGAWAFLTAVRGWTADANDTARRWYFNGSAWQDALAAQPYLDVSNSGTQAIPNGAAWTKVQLLNKNTDTDNGWNAANWSFTVPLTGVYLVEAMLRPVRSGTNLMPANTNLSMVFSTAGADSIEAVSATSPDLLDFTLLNTRPMVLNRTAVYALYAKHSAAAAIAFTYAQLRCTRVSVF